MSRRPLILVADDSEDIRRLFGVMLKKDYDVKFAVNSDETLASADTDPLPDLILLDVDMPSINGYEVCARLKSNPALADIPIIFVTGRAEPRDQAQGLRAGAVDYIVKPMAPQPDQRRRSGQDPGRRVGQAVRPQGGRGIHEGSQEFRESALAFQGRTRRHPRPRFRLHALSAAIDNPVPAPGATSRSVGSP